MTETPKRTRRHERMLNGDVEVNNSEFVTVNYPLSGVPATDNKVIAMYRNYGYKVDMDRTDDWQIVLTKPRAEVEKFLKDCNDKAIANQKRAAKVDKSKDNEDVKWVQNDDGYKPVSVSLGEVLPVDGTSGGYEHDV